MTDKKLKFWFYKPTLWWTGFLPFSTGSDEWNRKTYVLGYPFTGQLVIPSKKGVTYYGPTKDQNYIHICFETEHSDGGCYVYYEREVFKDENFVVTVSGSETDDKCIDIIRK